MHLATAVTRNNKSPISAHAFIVLIVDLKRQLNRSRATDQQAICLTNARVHAWIPVSGFKQQRKVSFDKWCCLNPEEYGSMIWSIPKNINRKSHFYTAYINKYVILLLNRPKTYIVYRIFVNPFPRPIIRPIFFVL